MTTRRHACRWTRCAAGGGGGRPRAEGSGGQRRAAACGGLLASAHPASCRPQILAGTAERMKNFAVIYLVDISEVPDFNAMYELYDPCTVMFFFRNKVGVCVGGGFAVERGLLVWV